MLFFFSIGRFEAVPDNLSAAEILSQVQSAAKDAADMLTIRQQSCRVGLLAPKDFLKIIWLLVISCTD
jgi:hypothetical protein